MAEQDDGAPWRRFTPAQIGQSLCLARTWNNGLGGQCTRSREDGADFCRQHKGDKWKNHGAVNGPIPDKKLREFERAAASSAGSPGQKAPAASPAASATPATASRPPKKAPDGAPAPPAASATPATASRPPKKALDGAPAPVKASATAKAPDAAPSTAPSTQPAPGVGRGVKRTAEVLLQARARKRFGVLSPAQLRAAEPKVLGEVIREGAWAGEGWEELCRKLESGDSDVKEEAVDKISAQWQKQVRESLKVMRSELEKHREAARLQKERHTELQQEKAAPQKGDGVPGRTSSSGTSGVSAAGAENTARTAGAEKTARSRNIGCQKFVRKVLGAKLPKAPKCTCGCPIHQEKCKLFRPPRYTSYTTFIGGRGGPGGREYKLPPGASRALGKAPFTLSQWASQEISKIVADVANLPRTEWKGAYRKHMLLFHPDKRMAPGNPFAGQSAEQVTEVFMELKRRYDRMEAVPGAGEVCAI